jgi:hypothetical protein
LSRRVALRQPSRELGRSWRPSSLRSPRGRCRGSFQGIKHAVADALDAALVLGDVSRADELFAFVDDLPPARRPPYLDAQVLRLRSRTSRDATGLEAAARRFAALEAPFPRALTLLEQSQLTHDESARLEACEIFARLGARPWLELAGGVATEQEAPVVG